MANYLLDTDTLIHFFRRKFAILEKIDAVGQENCYVSEISVAELLYGAYYSNQKEKHVSEAALITEEFNLIPISEVLTIYAIERARLRKAGTPVGSNDVFIAATALRFDLVLVSGNTKEMSRINGINLEDWTKPEHNEFIP